MSDLVERLKDAERRAEAADLDVRMLREHLRQTGDSDLYVMGWKDALQAAWENRDPGSMTIDVAAVKMLLGGPGWHRGLQPKEWQRVGPTMRAMPRCITENHGAALFEVAEAARRVAANPGCSVHAGNRGYEHCGQCATARTALGDLGVALGRLTDAAASALSLALNEEEAKKEGTT